MERAVLDLMRRGALPMLVGGASMTTAMYSYQADHAAALWQAWGASLRNHNHNSHHQQLKQRLQSQSYQHQAQLLHQHAATSQALALTGSVATYQALRDWHFYRGATTLPEMEATLASRGALFFTRPSVLGVALVAFGMVQWHYGTIRIRVEELFLLEEDYAAMRRRQQAR